MLKQLGEYKDRLYSILAGDNKIRCLLLGEDYEDKFDDLDSELEKYICPHLYTEPTVTETHSYIFFEIYIPRTTPSVKTMKIFIQTICHKNITKYKEKPKNYYGLRYDVLSQYVEELLCPADKENREKIIRSFGIGRIELSGVDLFLSNDFAGHSLTFSVPDFR